MRRKVRSKSVWQTKNRSKFRTKERGTQNVNWDMCAATRRCIYSRYPSDITEISLEFKNILWKVFRRSRIASHCLHGYLVSSGSTSKSKVDATGMQSGQRAELFSNRERRMVGKHDAARTETNRSCVRSNVSDQNCSGRGSNGIHVVMLGVPNAVEPICFSRFRYLNTSVESVGDGIA